MGRSLSHAGRLGLAAGVFFFAARSANAQVVVPPGSEVPIPPKPSADTTTARRDTVKAPFARPSLPPTADIGPQYSWNRDELFGSGALTVADLLERVPGATSFRSGWLASPKYVAMNGDLNRVRIYYDGIEVDNLDPRSAPMLDLTTVDIWTLENVRIERTANELKLHLTSWRVERTHPYTRTDVFTGDEDTNIYRGFFGRRFFNGTGLQLAGQQFSTRSGRLGGGGDALSFMGRAGIARSGWSVDAFATRRGGSRDLHPTFSLTDGLSIPPYDGTHTLMYLRTAVGDPAVGPWAQLILSHTRFGDRSKHITPSEAISQRLVADTTDTTVSRYQYVAAAGIRRGPVSLSVAERLRASDGETYHAPEIRLELEHALGVASLQAESNGLLKAKRVNLTGRFTPLPFLAAAGSLSTSDPDDDGGAGSEPPWTAARLELGIKLINPWLIGGIITRDTATLAGPILIDTAYKPVGIGKRQGLYAGLRGQIYKALNVDVIAMRWDTAGFYQPRHQARSEVSLVTRWLSRFPSGNFGIRAAFVHDYRGRVTFPTAQGGRTAAASNILSGLLEIRILSGIVSYQVRNIPGLNHQIVPDFFMPRSINIYGIRWEFWN